MKAMQIQDKLLWYDIILEPGDVIHRKLREFFEKEDLENAFVLSCVGSCSKVEVIYPLSDEFPPKLGRLTKTGRFEINGIQGSIRRQKDGDIKVHLHGSLTNEGKEVFGGAIREGTEIFLAAEILVCGIKRGG